MAVQEIPFHFEFYGDTVSQYKVSQNGLLTFEIQSKLRPGANSNLPAGLPNKTIAAFWDAFTGSSPTGSNDAIYTQTFGTAPNRQLWIKWYSFEMGNPAASYNYFACVLEETTHKIHLVDMNYHSTPDISATVGLQHNSSHAHQYGNENDELRYGRLFLQRQ